MTAERCMCGDTDCRRCYPGRAPEPSERDSELALEEIVECVLEWGQWPQRGRARFDLYYYLLENHDSSFMLEMYVSAMSSAAQSFEDCIKRERRTVKAMLIEHLRDSDMVADLAAEYAAEKQ